MMHCRFPPRQSDDDEDVLQWVQNILESPKRSSLLNNLNQFQVILDAGGLDVFDIDSPDNFSASSTATPTEEPNTSSTLDTMSSAVSATSEVDGADLLHHQEELGGETVSSRLELHSPIAHAEANCPPLDNIQIVWPVGASCDCVTRHHLPRCCQLDNFDYFKGSVEFMDEDFDRVRSNVKDNRTKSNRQMRFMLYKQVLVALDFGVLGPGERRRLPVCVEARIRQLYPSHTGVYRGFME